MSAHSYGGSPAFPGKLDTNTSPGMSLRDWFAGQALVGLGTLNPTLPNDLPEDPWPNPALLARRKAIWAYLQADAMLKERERTP